MSTDPRSSLPRRSLALRCAWLLALVGLSACERPPAAPELSSSPVYTNSAEGLRFLVPEGWLQSASSTLPPGPLGGEIFLARYNLNSAEQGASLQILCLDDQPDLDLARHHAEGSFRAAAWTPLADPRTLDIHGSPATQIRYRATLDGREMTKHVTSFRRRNRVYSFIGLYWSTDAYAEQQIDRAISSITWSR